MNYNKLKKLLDELYLSYKFKFSSKDPVWNLHRFSDEKDIELAGLVTAVYTYGSVDLINRFIELFLARINYKPYEFIINFSKHKDKKYLKGFSYRFNGENDLIKLINALRKVLTEYGSLKNLFFSGYKSEHENIIPALINFSAAINKNMLHRAGTYSHYMVSNPASGSAAKRMNLFLRWMVRKDEIDLGLWNNIPANKLIVPVDTHIAKISKIVKLIKRKTIDIKFAIELTETLKKFDPVDPVKYDFALCHTGIEKKLHLIP
jgi:uncharacterized protein (TIGR02757 family)